MKYMITLRDGSSAPGHDEHAILNRRVSGWLSELKHNKKVECIYYIFPGNGMCIIDVDSHEELLGFIRSWPFYKYTKFEVHPLADARYAVDNYYNRMLAPDAEETYAAE